MLLEIPEDDFFSSVTYKGAVTNFYSLGFETDNREAASIKSMFIDVSNIWPCGTAKRLLFISRIAESL